jgi:hypothetical protein
VPHLTIACALFTEANPCNPMIEFCLVAVALMLLGYAHAQPAARAAPGLFADAPHAAV